MKGLHYAVIVGFLSAAFACAQALPGAGGPMMGHRPGMGPMMPVPQRQAKGIESNFFPPALVMRHQQDLALTPAQEKTLRQDASKSAAAIVDLQWKEFASEASLANLIKAENPDEKAILAEQANLTTIKGDIASTHLALLIHVKNTLTPEQKTMLTEIERHEALNPWQWHRGWMHHEMMGRLWSGQKAWQNGVCPLCAPGQKPVAGPGMIRPVPSRFPIHSQMMGVPRSAPPAGAGQQ